jgi:hypothetical protein
MSVGEEFGKFLANFLNSVKRESIEWQKQNQAELLRLKKERAIGEEEILQELARMEVRFKGELKDLEISEQHKNEQFKAFLQSIDESQQQFIQRYPTMPKPIALMICYRASELLKEAWNNPNILERQKKESSYIHFMITMAEDLAEANETKALPEKTLRLLNAGKP